MEEEKKKETSFVDKLWDVLASVKLAIIVFALISLTSIVGTILEQGVEPEKNIMILAKFVGQSAAPSVYSLLDGMGFTDMYRSWWFVGFLMVFSVNLIICSLDRLPPVWRAVKDPMKPLPEASFKTFQIKRELVLRGSPAENRASILGLVKGLGFGTPALSEGAEEEGGYQYYAQRQPYARLGIYITHLSILVILAGAVVGVFLGFKGFLNIPEGWSYPVAFSTRANVDPRYYDERDLLIDTVVELKGDLKASAQKLGVTEERLKGRLQALGVEPLGFSVRCDDFSVDFYGSTDQPKEFSSDLVVIDGGAEVMKKTIEVNDPLVYKGYIFYQSSYSMYGSPANYTFRIRPHLPGAPAEIINMKLNQPVVIPGMGGAQLTIADFSPALGKDASGRTFTYNQEMMNNPAVRVELKGAGLDTSGWIWKRFPQTWELGGGASIELVDVWGAQYTGLQVRRDPGVWIVYLGCLVMSVGLYMAFFMSHRRIWVKALPAGKGGTRLLLAASAHKQREGFERIIDRASGSLTDGGKK